MVGPHRTTALDAIEMAASRQGAEAVRKFRGYGGGWAKFSDRRRGLPFQPQRDGLHSWGPEARWKRKMPRKREREVGKEEWRRSETAERTRRHRRWVVWASRTTRPYAGWNVGGTIRPRQFGAMSKRRWAGCVNAQALSTPSTGAALSTAGRCRGRWPCQSSGHRAIPPPGRRQAPRRPAICGIRPP